jgi:AcrR family transcriptional regulator
LSTVAQVSKRTAYQHFTSKDELGAEYLRRFDPDVMPGVFDCTDLTPRERLIAAVLIDNAIPSPSPWQPCDDHGTTGSVPVQVGGQ